MSSFIPILIILGVVASIVRKYAGKTAMHNDPRQTAAPAQTSASAAAAPPSVKIEPVHEGTVSYEGEQNHAEHVEHILERERQEQESADEAEAFYTLNREQLQQAVVMSEVLGKPLALRRRRI